MDARPLVSVVIPVFNEVSTIQTVVDRVAGAPFEKEIVLVDDGSTDGTREVLDRVAREERRPDGPGGAVPVRVYFQPSNRGKGAAVRRGLAQAKGAILAIQDADLEYDPDDLPALLDPIVSGEADVVYGSRFLGDVTGARSTNVLGNRLLTAFSNLVSGLRLTDMETGYKIFRREAIEPILPTLKSERFDIEPELTAKVARHGLRIVEVPIAYAPRDHAAGKKIRWRDGLGAVRAIVRYRIGD